MTVRGEASNPNSSLTATPMRLVPTSSARIPPDIPSVPYHPESGLNPGLCVRIQCGAEITRGIVRAETSECKRHLRVSCHDTPPRAYSFVAPPIGLTSPSAPTPVVDIPFTGVAAGEYLVRIAVDGAESPLGVDANGAYDAPTVVVP